MADIYPVILSGGAGTRLWPLSRSLSPKQLLPLAGPQTLIQDTVLRVLEPQFHAPLIVCHNDHRFQIAEQMREIGIETPALLLEPTGRNTASAATAAAMTIIDKDPDALLLFLPADHTLRDIQAFHHAVAAAASPAAHGKLVMFGIVPTYPETGYGYIQRGARLADKGPACAVARFVEKPNAEKAGEYVTSGDYLWNSGMFLFKADTFLTEIERLEPSLFANCRVAVSHARQEGSFLHLGREPFESNQAISLDYALMERTALSAVIPVEMGWSDVGSWAALWDRATKDENANVIQGDVFGHDVRGSYLRSEGPLLAAVGVQDLVIVATTDAVLVCHKDAAQDVKKVVDRLNSDGRTQHIAHPTTLRPWGSYESLDSGEGFQIKHIVVKPGAKLSLQMHQKRAEHWTVVSGTAIVTCDDQVFTLQETQSTFIPLGARHRLENPGARPLHLIEVQWGSYLGEDDIVRFEDLYGR